MDIQIENIENVTVVHLKGTFDSSARGKMEMELLSVVSYRVKLVFDLSDVEYISSAGLRLLLELYRRCEQQNGFMALTGFSDQVYEVYSQAGLSPDILPVYGSLEAGISAVQTETETKSGMRGFGFEDSGEIQEELLEDVEPEMEDVSFTAFYPKEVAVEKWHTMLVYTYVSSALEAIRKDAQKFEDEIGDIRESKPASTQLARGTEITIVPTCEGVTFNPERVTFRWLEDRHRAEFRLRADASMADMAGNVQVTMYVGPLIVGTLKMGMLLSETEASPGGVGSEEVNARMYRQDDIFVSYSHRDTDIVKKCKTAYEALGHNILIDFETLRSGQQWNAELMRMIERANIFQLFWSENSSKSEYCRQEWQYALELERGEGFIRPVFWKEPIPTPPAELSDLHFDYAPFAIQD